MRPKTISAPLLLFLALLGCPANDTQGDDEIGEDGAPEPLDPLDGGGGVPLGEPNVEAAWPSPTILGSGFVHDSRLDLDGALDQRDSTNVELAFGVPWSGFVTRYQAMTHVGFRPAQVRAEVSVYPSGSDSSILEIRDQSLYVSDDDANYRTEIESYLFANTEAEAERAQGSFAPATRGARPLSINTFSVGRFGGYGGFELGFAVAWAYDGSNMPWQILAGQSEAAMSTAILDLRAMGYRPISIASRKRQQGSEFAAIFVQDELANEDWTTTLGLDIGAVDALVQTKWDEGFYPVRVSAEQGSSTRVNLLWVRRPPGISVQIRLNLSSTTFPLEDATWRAHGYHLESIDQYDDDDDDDDDDGDRRHLAIWVRYEPYLRWQGTPFDAGDPTYLARYAMFHDQAIRQMSFTTEVDCSGGQPCPTGTSCFTCPNDDTPCFLEGICVEPDKFRKVLRPSGTLHIFEGAQLVLSRAYTFAPAIYPETPIDAPMKLASVSKSITAAAVVREMAAQSLPLTTSFNVAAGIAGAPAAMDAVTVLDVLRNLGGFETGPTSYYDHALIDASIYGAIPIDGEEMLAYAIAGHLNVGGGDNYWNSAFYNNSQSTNTLKYSNPGFSMLGELVRVLSGKLYEGYVVDTLLAPLGLEQSIYADPAHRMAERGPTQAGKRAYLVNADHPYHVKPAQQAAAQGNCPGGPLGWLWDGSNCVLLWACGCSGADCGRLYGDESDCDQDHQIPLEGSLPLPTVPKGDRSTTWADNSGPVDPAAPKRASWSRYSGDFAMGGALLAAGGWHGDGVSLAILIRAASQGDAVMTSSVASQLWAPPWWNRNGSPASNWSYGLGWYVRGNWVAWAGGETGSMATVLHNRAYDFTVVYLTNVIGNGLSEFMDPLMKPQNGSWNTSMIGAVLPCVDDPSTPASECTSVTTQPY